MLVGPGAEELIDWLRVLKCLSFSLNVNLFALVHNSSADRGNVRLVVGLGVPDQPVNVEAKHSKENKQCQNEDNGCRVHKCKNELHNNC